MLLGAGAACLVLLSVFVADLSRPFGNSDEVIYAEYIREMHRSGDYFTLRYQGVELHQRPPTAVALYAASAYVIPGELGIRLLPALFTLLVCIGAGALVWRWSDRVEAGFAAAFFAAAVPSVFLYGRLAFSDPPFVLASIAALAATIAAQKDSRWLPWAGGALGAAFAIKSIAAAIPLLVLLPWLVVAVRGHREKSGTRRHSLLAAAWFAGLALPYYLYNFATHGGEFWREHFGRVLFDRAAGQLEDVVSIGGPSAYFKHVWQADGAIIALAILASVVAVTAAAVKRKDRQLGVLATYTIGTFLLLSAAGTRLPHYLLVFYPAAAICVGMAVVLAWQALPESNRLAVVIAPVACAGLFLQTAAADPFDQIAVPAHDAQALAKIVIDHPEETDTVYSFNWYAPAFGYYAKHKWSMLTDQPRVAKTVGNTGPFRKTKSIILVPPWPTTRGFYLAGPKQLVLSLGGIHREIRGEAGNMVLIWAKPL